MSNIIPETELILNPNGSVYHLKLLPENIVDNIIIVGDQGRVEAVSKFFDKIDFKQGLEMSKAYKEIFYPWYSDTMQQISEELDGAKNRLAEQQAKVD